MRIVSSSHDLRIPVPSSIETAHEADAWLSSMSDSGWRVLTDFRNWSIWIPEIHSVKQEDSEPPARGTNLQVNRGHRIVNCSIEVWDPPRRLQYCLQLANGELAFGFLVEASPQKTELRLSLELERSLIGPSRIAAFFFKWRLQKLGSKILANLATRTRPATKI